MILNSYLIFSFCIPRSFSIFPIFSAFHMLYFSTLDDFHFYVFIFIFIVNVLPFVFFFFQSIFRFPFFVFCHFLKFIGTRKPVFECRLYFKYFLAIIFLFCKFYWLCSVFINFLSRIRLNIVYFNASLILYHPFDMPISLSIHILNYIFTIFPTYIYYLILVSNNSSHFPIFIHILYHIPSSSIDSFIFQIDQL